MDVSNEHLKWTFPFALNFLMAGASVLIAQLAEIIWPGKPSKESTKPQAPFTAFWKASLSNTIASPIGYTSLKYISFPLMVLTKSSKPVPVILIGAIAYGRKYSWYKYVSVGMICLGIALFSSAKKGSSSQSTTIGSNSMMPSQELVIGLVLVLINLSLDGYTNNEQDAIFISYESTSLRLMKCVNLWQVIYLSVLLTCLFGVYGNNSEPILAYHAFSHSSLLRWDIFEFCLYAGAGQVLIFQIMKDFGSLAWVTISVTRKLFTIMVSVFAFNHHVNNWQWGGVVSVFIGMTLDVVMAKADKKKKDEKAKKEQ